MGATSNCKLVRRKEREKARKVPQTRRKLGPGGRSNIIVFLCSFRSDVMVIKSIVSISRLSRALEAFGDIVSVLGSLDRVEVLTMLFGLVTGVLQPLQWKRRRRKSL